jgi:hypothetical protein
VERSPTKGSKKESFALTFSRGPLFLLLRKVLLVSRLYAFVQQFLDRLDRHLAV